MHEDELLDLVNKEDQVIGTLWRSEYDRLEVENLGFIRAAEVLIVNNKGEVWIPVRTADKRIAPNGLDYSAQGHVTSGETYEETILKEISEELNLNLGLSDLEFVGSFGPDTHRYFRKLFLFRSNEEPKYNPQDFQGASWLLPEKVIEKLESGVEAKASLREGIVAVIGYLAVHP